MSYLNDIEFILNELENLSFNFDYSDKVKTKTEFNYIINNLQQDNFISEKTCQNIYLSDDLKYICCGSYKVKINR